jgi:arylsulfatase A-like enzyme
LLLINLPGTDIEGHVSGGVINRRAMSHVVRSVDHAIGTIVDAYKRAGLYNRTDFVITADHGMVPNTHVVPIKAMYAAKRATGAPGIEDDLLTTAGYLYLRDPKQASAVATQLVGRHFPWVEGAFYKVSTGPNAGFKAESATARTLGPALTRAYIDLCNTLASPSGPDIVLPYAEDSMGLTVPHARHWGNHGGLSWRVQHVPLVISGPGVRPGLSTFPAELVDVAPTMERLLSLPVPRGVDGVVLADALTANSQEDRAVERARTPSRAQDVAALLKHSLRQHGAHLGSNPSG